MEFVAGEEERDGERRARRRRDRRGGGENRGREGGGGGVAGWERQVFGSELSPVLRRGDVHRK